jgi:hypothetical protein
MKCDCGAACGACLTIIALCLTYSIGYCLVVAIANCHDNYQEKKRKQKPIYKPANTLP